MEAYLLRQTLIPLSDPPESESEGGRVLLLSSQELSDHPADPLGEDILPHTPLARDARVCKGEVRGDYLCGTVVTPRHTKSGTQIAFGYLLTREVAVLCDDTQVTSSMLRRLAKERQWQQAGVGTFFHEFLTLLLAKDPHHLQELENQLEGLESRVLGGSLANFGAQMSALRKELFGWMRYYAQLASVVDTLAKNEPGFFPPQECQQLRMLAQRLLHLKDEAYLLREYSLQVQGLFQAEIGILQNRMIQLLTVMTTTFMPLTLLLEWYGMTTSGLDVSGYPLIVASGVLLALGCLWVINRKRFR